MLSRSFSGLCVFVFLVGLSQLLSGCGWHARTVEQHSVYGNPKSYVVNGHRYYVADTSKGYDKKGIASWYGEKFHGHLTSTREVYDMYGMTAASTTLPLPTYVRVTNLQNGRQVIVKVNDRGPFLHHRILDLSYTAAKKLGFARKGTAMVRVTALDRKALSKQKDVLANLPVAHHQLYMQVGAYSDEHHARVVKHHLTEMIKYPVMITHVGGKAHPIFQVRVGPLPSVRAFDWLSNNLKEQGYGSVMTVIG